MNELYSDIKLICENENIKLYDIEQAKEDNRNILRVYITSQSHVSVDECAKISRLISPLLDTNPPFSGEYFLEVSSPGLERSLKKVEHFKNSIGENIKIKTTDNKKFQGKLSFADDQKITLLSKNKSMSFLYPQIKKAKTYIKW